MEEDARHRGRSKVPQSSLPLQYFIESRPSLLLPLNGGLDFKEQPRPVYDYVVLLLTNEKQSYAVWVADLWL